MIHNKAIDIETGALPLAEIAHLKPAFSAPGNYKDPYKIAENIAEQEARWFEKAALSPLTGQILVIGIKPFGLPVRYLEGPETGILADFWQEFGDGVELDKWHGHAITGFDLPFIIKRSWLHGITVPMSLLFTNGGRYINDRRFVDTMTAFQCGDRNDFVGLDRVAKFFGLPGKTEDLGAQFAEIYRTDRARALAYLGRDLEIVENVSNRMFAYDVAA